MSLVQFFPRPERIRLAGGDYPVSELRLRDLADLEHYAAGALGHPLDKLDESAADYPDRLRAAYDGADRWPPSLDTPEADAAVFGSAAGRALFTLLALRGARVTEDEARGLLLEMEPREWAALEKAAFGGWGDIRAEAARRIDHHLGIEPFAIAPDDGDEDAPRCLTLLEVVVATVRDFGLTPAEVGELTMSQIRALRSGGKPAEHFDLIPNDPDEEERVQGLRRAFWGEETGNPGQDTTDSP